MRDYISQQLEPNMLCRSDSLLCLTSYWNRANGEFEIIYTNSIHDYIAVSTAGPNYTIGVIRSAASGFGLRCFSTPGINCTSPPSNTDMPEQVPLSFNIPVISLQAELAAENTDGSPKGPIQGSISFTNGQYVPFGVHQMNPSGCAQTGTGPVQALVRAVYVSGVQFGGNVGTRDAVVIEEYELGATYGNHMERYFYVHGLGRVREGSAVYDTSTGVYDLSRNNSVRNTLRTNTISIPAPQCPRGSAIAL